MEKSRLFALKMINIAREWKETLEASRPRLLALDNISWKKETRQKIKNKNKNKRLLALDNTSWKKETRQAMFLIFLQTNTNTNTNACPGQHQLEKGNQARNVF